MSFLPQKWQVTPFRLGFWVFSLVVPFPCSFPKEFGFHFFAAFDLFDSPIQTLQVEALIKVFNLLKLPQYLSPPSLNLQCEVFCIRSMLEDPPSIFCYTPFFCSTWCASSSFVKNNSSHTCSSFATLSLSSLFSERRESIITFNSLLSLPTFMKSW